MDKYAHLRPPKPRSCFRADRVPKVRFTQAEAEAKAAEWAHDGYAAYRCPHCGAWHVGRDRRNE